MEIRDSATDRVAKEDFGLHLFVGRHQSGWHRHIRHQLLYAEGGVLHLQTEHNHFLLPARHGAWIPSRRPHFVQSNSAELYLRTLYFAPRPDDDPAWQRLHIFPITPLAREMILYTQRWDREQPPTALEASFFETLRLLICAWLNQSIPLVLPATDHPQLQPVIADIQQHLAGSLQLEPLAGRHGFSGRTLMRLFNKELGMTFGTYLRVARIIRALELLSQPGLTITEVAYAVGYRSLSSFSQTFRQLIGVWPQSYLKSR